MQLNGANGRVEEIETEQKQFNFGKDIRTGHKQLNGKNIGTGQKQFNAGKKLELGIGSFMLVAKLKLGTRILILVEMLEQI